MSKEIRLSHSVSTRTTASVWFQPKGGTSVGHTACRALFCQACPQRGGSLQVYAVKMRSNPSSKLMRSGVGRNMECFAQTYARYVLGTEIGRKSYIVGLGHNGQRLTTHHGASCPAYPEACPANVQASAHPDFNEITGALFWQPLVRSCPRVLFLVLVFFLFPLLQRARFSSRLSPCNRWVNRDTDAAHCDRDSTGVGTAIRAIKVLTLVSLQPQPSSESLCGA